MAEDNVHIMLWDDYYRDAEKQHSMTADDLVRGSKTNNKPMSTEEKANELVKKHIFDSNHYETAMEMAKWKEQQMIEKAVKWLYEHALDFNENGQKFYEQQLLIEKFKQAMEE